MVYLAKGVQATTAIEGNTLSEKEVLAQLKGELDLPKSREYLRQETSNIIDACNGIGERVLKGEESEVTTQAILLYNAQVLQGLDLEDGIVPGKLRTHSVGIAATRYRGAPQEDCEFLLDELVSWLNTDLGPDPDNRIVSGLIRAIVAHVYLAWIHPFGDGNGRTARLLEFDILLKSGVPSPAAHLLSNHYNETRQQYYRFLNQSSKESDGIIPFVEYAIRGFVDCLDTALSTILNDMWNMAWKEYVYDFFTDRKSSTDARRRQLVLDLSKQPNWYPIAKIRELSPSIAVEYAGKTDQTIINDINRLLKELLIEKQDQKIRANKRKLLERLPARINEE